MAVTTDNHIKLSTGRAISHVSLTPSDLKSGMLAAGLPEEYADWLIDLERYNREEQEQASLITNDIEQLTGREPIRLAQFARDHAALLQPQGGRPLQPS